MPNPVDIKQYAIPKVFLFKATPVNVGPVTLTNRSCLILQNEGRPLQASDLRPGKTYLIDQGTGQLFSLPARRSKRKHK